MREVRDEGRLMMRRDKKIEPEGRRMGGALADLNKRHRKWIEDQGERTKKGEWVMENHCQQGN